MTKEFLIEADELAAALACGELLLVDTRKADRYAAGHIPGAVNLSTYDVFVPDTSEARLAQFRADMARRYGAMGAHRERRVVVYEDDTGMRAARELWILEYLGHRHARMLHGGLKAWIASGGPVTTDVPQPHPARFDTAPRPELGIGADEIKARIGASGFTLIDTRDQLEWSGRDHTPCCERRGRLPGAVHLEWTELLENGRFKSPETIHALLRERGIDPQTELVPYCHRGARAANTFYALRYAGAARVRNYLGSWHEWSARSDLPLEL